MDFLNGQISTDTLPKAEEVQLTPLQPGYLKVLRLQWAIFFFILLAIMAVLFGLVERMRNPVLMYSAGAGWLLLAIVSYWYQQLSFAVKGYAIRDKDVIYQTGLIFRDTYTCPFNRIQNTTVTMGPLERKFGLAKLILYTAGTSDADLDIPGLQEETARSLKEWINKKIADEPESNV